MYDIQFAVHYCSYYCLLTEMCGYNLSYEASFEFHLNEAAPTYI
jgi:hypothetical protein